jgi:glyoxylase-like metal-dependent hydrolase (beta-lactamase superfamily II)
VVTHSHPDHFGGAARLRAATGADIITHQSFRLWFDPNEPDDVDVEIAARHKRGTGETPWGGPGYQLPLRRKMYYNAFRVLPQLFKVPQPTVRLAEGEYISLARRKWMAIHTPGHTEDHLCLFDADTGVMLCGDHVLPTITPHISGMSKYPDPLAGFFNSLDKVGAFGSQVGICLPAHGKPFADIATRCEQIKEHHQGRLEKLRTSAAELDRPATVTEFSSHLFSPRAQGTMADSETFAHLEHLRIAGEFSFTVREGVREYVRIS